MFTNEDEPIELPEDIQEISDLLETITDKKEFKRVADHGNKIAGKKIFSTTLKTSNKMATTKTKKAAKKVVAPKKKAAPAKKAAKKAPVKKIPVTKKAVVKKSATNKKEKVSQKITVDARPIIGNMGRIGSKKNEILSLYAKGKTIPQIKEAFPYYAENTILGAIFHAIRTTPVGINGGGKKKK